MRLSRAVYVAALCSALVGCNCQPGGNDGGSGGGSGGSGGSGGNGGNGGNGGGTQAPGIELADFCSTAVTGMKDQLFREEATCGTPLTQADVDHILYQGFVTFAEAYSGSDCNDGGLGSQMKKYRDAVAAGRLEYNREKALECQVKGRATKNDGGFPFKSFDGKLVDPCSQIWTPKVAANGACEADYECVGDNYCKPTNANSCGGTCVARLALGSSCTPIRNECNMDGFCDEADGGYKCLPYLGPGEVCVDNNGNQLGDCRGDLTCIGDSDNGGVDTCLPISKLNEPCKRWPGVGSNCGEGTCISDAGTVAGALGLCLNRAALGQRCGDGFNGFGLCESCLMCDEDAGASPTCVSFGKAGYACTDDSECLNAYYFCNLAPDAGSGVCALKPRQNEPCVVDDNGDYGNCMYWDNWCKKNQAGNVAVPGVCTPVPGIGGQCGDRYDLYPGCPTGTYCKGDTDAGVGVCAAQALRDQRCNDEGLDIVTQVATDCANAADFCDTRPDAGGDGFYDGICHARSGDQQLCNSDVPCQTGLNCLPRLTPTDGGLQKCVPPKQNGAACDSDTECQSSWCKADAGMVCAPLIAAGLPCVEDSECATGVCDPVSQVCVAFCGVETNPTGCMAYDLNSMSGYIFFSIVLVPLWGLRRKQKKS